MTEDHAEALRLLADAASRSKRSNVAFSRTFMTTPGLAPQEEAPTTPLSRLIQGGRGGEVRLKLYLLLTMIATREPYDIKRLRTPQTLGRTLELPKATGPRRINSNLNWLKKNNYISLNREGNGPTSVQLLDPLDDGKPLSNPRNTKPYVTIPIEFWSNGWLLDLSPTGIAILFALAERLGGATRPTYLLRDRRVSYGLSHDTWTRGTAELESHDILTVKRVPQGNDFDYTRMRNVYWIEWERLKTPSKASGGGRTQEPPIPSALRPAIRS